MSAASARGQLEQAMAALRVDLVHADGPRISTMRNYRFAIVPYAPEQEFALRAEVQKLSTELVANGWVVLSISLQRLLLDRVKAQGQDWAQQLIADERELSGYSRERGLSFVAEEITPLIEGPEGIAADCARIVQEHVAAHPEKADRTVVLIGRAGALVPFFRSSALLRHIDGHTGNVPVVLLYPGHRSGQTGLSFMGVHKPDNDYRPRIYP